MSFPLLVPSLMLFASLVFLAYSLALVRRLWGGDDDLR